MKRQVAVMAGVIVGLTGCGGVDHSGPSERTQAAPASPVNRIDGAYDFCIEQIVDQLKAPATAEFSERSDDTEAADGDRRFLFTGTVDSQNGFGAFIRSEWGCEILWSPSTGFVADAAIDG